MNPIKPTIKTEIIPLFVVIITLVSSFYFYANFPERVPIHWNAAGEVDNWGSRFTGAFLFPLVVLGIYLLFLALPYLDPKKDRYAQFRKTYHVFKGFMVFVMAVLYYVASLTALGYNIPIVLSIPVLIGLMFIVIGNYMSKIKPNWFMGIRTPWTLSSEEVWNKTHRFGGKVFMLGGFVIMIMFFVPVAWRGPLLIIDVIGTILGTVGYSYLVYRREEKEKRNNITKKPL